MAFHGARVRMGVPSSALVCRNACAVAVANGIPGVWRVAGHQHPGGGFGCSAGMVLNDGGCGYGSLFCRCGRLFDKVRMSRWCYWR